MWSLKPDFLVCQESHRKHFKLQMGCVFSKSQLLLHVFLNFESSEYDFVKPKYFRPLNSISCRTSITLERKKSILVFLHMLHAVVHKAFPFLVACSSRQVLFVQNNSVLLLTRGFLFVSQIRTHRDLSMVRHHLALQALFLLLRLFKQLGGLWVFFILVLREQFLALLLCHHCQSK